MTTDAYLYVGALVFAAGAVGTLTRTSAIGRLSGVELMFASAMLTFAASAVGLRELDGQVAALLVGVVAVAHGAVGLAVAASARRPM